MGFAVGSSLLTIRAAFRVLRSVAAVVAGATFITVLLPFHEVTGEIAARTTPTALDLMVAVCCALTAAYTTVRAASDTTAAAAGTAVGIALVPPLCVVGYGLGTRAPDVAAGAALLFTANFSAIVVFSVLAFVLLGFNWVDARRLERDYLRRDRSIEERAAERVHGVLGRLFGSRYGMAMRIGLPALFLAFVYAPLARALDEVAWQCACAPPSGGWSARTRRARCRPSCRWSGAGCRSGSSSWAPPTTRCAWSAGCASGSPAPRA
jgi:uncharacterized membrane protein